MIDVTTLQIGNLVLDDDGKTLMVVSRIESKEYMHWDSGNEYNIVCLKLGTEQGYYEGEFLPLPITEERLREAGFVPKNVGFPDEYLTLDGKLFWWKDCGNEFFFHKTESGSVVIDAWHDLQNLVRLLTGKEL